MVDTTKFNGALTTLANNVQTVLDHASSAAADKQKAVETQAAIDQDHVDQLTAYIEKMSVSVADSLAKLTS